MTKKLLKGAVFICACYLLMCITASCISPPDDDIPEMLSWDKSACKVLDYAIDGDRITIRYSVRIVNSTPDADLELSNFTLYYAPETVTGWLKYQQYYICSIEGGDYSVMIPSGETVDVILVLEGTYFHGEVPTEIPLFSNMRYMLKIAN